MHTKYENRNPKITQAERKKLKSYKERSHANIQMEFTKLMENYILQIVDDTFSKIKVNRKDFSNKTKTNEILENYILFIDDISKEII